MGRIRIKHPRPKELGTRSQLLQLLAQTVKVTRLIPTNDAVIVLTASDNDTDAVFQEDLLKTLSSKGFSAILPPELKAQRTVICLRLDDLVYQYDAPEIKNEAERVQTWARIQEVYKFPKSNTVKFTFQSSEMARKAREEGLRLFSISISPHQIKEEKYIELLSCNKCYAIESHSTKQCPCPQDYIICSECTSREHTFRECTATEKSCLHCGQAHSCKVMRCPARKKAMQEKEERLRQVKNNPPTTYAQATATPSPDTSGLNLTGLVCVLHAHMVNCADPGSFQTTLSESLALNGLPDVKLPPNPPSQAIIKAITGKLSPIQEPHQVAEDREEQTAESSTTEEDESDVDIEHNSPDRQTHTQRNESGRHPSSSSDHRPHTKRNESGRHTSLSPSRRNSRAPERQRVHQKAVRKYHRRGQARPSTGQ